MENTPRVTYVRECVVIFRSEKIDANKTDNVRAGIAFVMRKLKVMHILVPNAKEDNEEIQF